MAEHHLKVDPPLWPDVLSRRKKAEIRLDDRNYQVGDYLRLQPFDRATQTWTSDDFCLRRVTHIVPGGQYGIAPGYVMMSMD